jgi:thiamine-phosphate diphosphorylase
VRPAYSVPVPCLCLVTDRKLCSDESLEERVAAAVSGGVDMVQLREKDLPAEELLKLALRLRTITQGKALLVINDSLDVALAVEADGLHLPQESPLVRQARQMAPPDFLIGKSVHDHSSASVAYQEGADYLILGTIFPTASKPGVAPGGIPRVFKVASTVAAPVLAIGGVNSHNIASVIGAGAYGVAVSSAILGATDAKGAAQELKEALVAVWKVWRATVGEGML